MKSSHVSFDFTEQSGDVLRVENRTCGEEALPEHGGPRGTARLVYIRDAVRVTHRFMDNAAEGLALWMLLDDEPTRDFLQAGALGMGARSDLWYIPRRTLVLSDTVDLATYLQVGTSDLAFKKPHLILAARRNLTGVDTIVFRWHLDPWYCGRGAGARCCLSPTYAPRQFPVVYLTEIIGLHGWRRFECPGHPALRFGSRREQCLCKQQHVSKEEQRWYDQKHPTSQGSRNGSWWEGHDKLCA